MGVLNGKAWHFFDNQIPKPAGEKLATTVDLQKPEAASYFAKLLARSVWESEDADTLVAKSVEEVAEDIRKCTKLSEIAEKLEQEMEAGFTQDEAGLKKAVQHTLEPNEKELALESLAELSRMLLTAEETSPRSDTSALKESSDLIEALKTGVAKTKPTQKKGTPSDLKVWVGGDEVAVSSWRDVTCGIAEAFLILNKRSVLEETGLVNKHLDERTKGDGRIYSPHAYRKLSDSTYLFLHAGAVAHSKRCKKMLNLINAPAQVIRIIYKTEEFYLP